LLNQNPLTMKKITASPSWILFLFFTLSSIGGIAQNGTPKSIFDCVYQAEGIPVIKIETNWNKLINQKMEEEYIPGKVTLPCGDFDIRVRARGIMRKQVCFFPPVKIDFKNGQLEKQKLDTSIDKLKVVFQCRTGEANSEFLLREKLCYDLYKVVNPEYHVLHKQVKFECMDEGKVKYALDGLIVEDEGEIADRMAAKVIEVGKVMAPSLDHDIYLRMVFFQYMIGNTDWSIPNKHNVEMVKVPNLPKIVPIAYDFDYAALVGTPYAVPHESLPIKSIYERYFMGHGVTEADALATAKYFVSKKDALLQVVTDFKGLDDKSKASIKKFLNPFFAEVENEKVVKRTFVQE